MKYFLSFRRYTWYFSFFKNGSAKEIRTEFILYKTLYVDIAEHFGTSRDNVEHCIRTAISNCWYKGNRELLIKIAGYKLKQKPAIGEFIDILYNYLSQTG